MPVAEYKQVIDVDLIAPFIVGKRVAPGMIKKRAGKIINMCSMIRITSYNVCYTKLLRPTKHSSPRAIPDGNSAATPSRPDRPACRNCLV